MFLDVMPSIATYSWLQLFLFFYFSLFFAGTLAGPVNSKSFAFWCLLLHWNVAKYPRLMAESVFAARSRFGHYHSEMRCVRVEVVQAHGKSHHTDGKQQQLH